MDYIVVTGVRPYDGRYEFDLEGQELTTREWGWIKRLSGYLPVTVEEGLSDPELIVVFAVIALRRSGKVDARDVPDVFERLSDAPFGAAITMETEKAEKPESDVGPPELSSTLSVDTSGRESTNSETSQETPDGSGNPQSDTLASVPTRLVS
jgi:hypothetical protein